MESVSNASELNTTGSNVQIVDRNVTLNLYVEDYELWIKLTFVVFGTFSVFACMVAQAVLGRTKRIPHSTKFLTHWLLAFDGLYILSVSVRKFIPDPGLNLNIHVLSMVVLQCSYMSICMMAVERLVVFKWPFHYTRYCTKPMLRRTLLVSCLTNAMLFLTLRYLGCYLQHMNTLFLVQAGLCSMITRVYYSFVLNIVLVVPTACYINISRIIQRQAKLTKRTMSFMQTANELCSYKATSVVLIYLAVIISAYIGFVVIVILWQAGFLYKSSLRWSIEIVASFSCFLDPYLYVMWFKESKMELLKLMCPTTTYTQRKVEAMRLEIFSVVTLEKRPGNRQQIP